MWETALLIAGWSLFGIAIAIGLLLDLVGLFGNWIILAATAIAFFATGFDHFSWAGLAIMLVFAALGEVFEALAAGYGAKRFGGGKGSMVAALVGCIAGAIAGSPLFPIVGTLIGACIGAFAGAALYEYIQVEKEMKAAIWTGVGAALGRVVGLFAKLFMGIAMLIVAAITF